MTVEFIGNGGPDGTCLCQGGEKVAFLGGTPSLKVTLTSLASAATLATAVSSLKELIDELTSKGLIGG